MSPLVLLLLMPIVLLGLRIMLTLTGWLIWLLCLIAMIALVHVVIVWGMAPSVHF